MNAAQLLRQIPEPIVAQEQDEETVCNFVPAVLTEGVHYTSDAMEEDFSDAVEMLMNTPKFLQFLKDADAYHRFLGEKALAELDEHIERIEHFTGQWLNSE